MGLPERIIRLKMPYRIDIPHPPDDILDRLVEWSALDVDTFGDGVAAILPDNVTPEFAARSMGTMKFSVSPALARDEGSVWLLRPRSVRIGSVLIVPPDTDAPANALRITDSAAFGTGHHPTTALCIEAIEEALTGETPESLLDVGTGSGILVLAALFLGAPRAVGLDTDADALRFAAENARLNKMEDRFQFVHGGPGAVDGTWPLVVANVLAAPLIEMAPALIRHVGSHGRLILSGIPGAVESEVRRCYERLGMRHLRSETRAGWTVLVLQASW